MQVALKSLASNWLYQAHKKQALHNYNFVQSLSSASPQFPDWLITGLFYMALHCVNAHAARRGWKWKRYRPRDPRKISRHTQTLRYVKKTFGMPFFKDYMHLSQECYNARYDPFYLKKIAFSMAGKLFKIAMKFLKII